jgi:hypothetical protein
VGWKTKMPLGDTHPLKDKLGNLTAFPSDGRPATAPCVFSTPSLRSRCVYSTSSHPALLGHHRSDGVHHRSGRSASVRLVRPTCQTGPMQFWAVDHLDLALRINQGTQWFSGEPLQTSRAWCSLHAERLDLASKFTPARCWLLNQPTNPPSNFDLLFSHHVTHTWSRLATRSIEPILLVSPVLWRPRKAKTFRTCSSHAPTHIKPQPTSTRQSTTSVHTKLSIIIPKEWPSTDRDSLRSSNLNEE